MEKNRTSFAICLLQFTFCLFLFPQNGSAQTYCTTKGTAPWEYWISNVSFNTINNTSENFKDYATLGYSDYTNISTDVSKGQSYNLSVIPGLSWVGNQPNTFVEAWIDYNQNGIFEDTEKVLEQTNLNLFAAKVLIPSDAKTGATRMRVALKFGGIATACESFDKGEVEDYKINIQNSGINTACRTQDSLQLISLYDSTNGSNWTNKWDLAKPIDTWYGITLNSNGCVIQISLRGNNLTGVIPNLNLDSLLRLSLWQNNLSGTIPNFNLPNLKTLYLDDNQLSDTIPNFTTQSLESISFTNNQFTGSLPDFNLPNLKAIYVDSNKLSGSLPLLQNTPNLVVLYANQNQFKGVVPNFNFPLLATLNLSKNQFTGVVPNFNFPALTTLDLSVNQFTGTIPLFENLNSLRDLSLSYNQLTGSIPNFNFPSLLTLNLNNNQLTGTIPNFIFPNFTQLLLSSNKLSGCIPASFKSFCGKIVDLSNNPNLGTQNFVDFCSNNTGGCDSNLPDLTAASLITDQSAVQGGGLNYKITIKNIGKGSNSKSFNNRIYISKDSILSSDDIIARDFVVSYIFPSNSSLTYATAQLQIPTALVPFSNYYLIAKIDFDNQILEDNEDNNIVVSGSTFAVTSSQDVNSCRTHDSLQLVSLYNATNGANWTNKWDLTKPINTWYGIGLNANGCVFQIFLNANNLVGTIPDLQLSYLVALALYDNKLIGEIPNFKLPLLDRLYLSGNQLTGTIPNFDLPNLTTIDLYNNQLTGSIPNFTLLPKLRGILLFENKLTGSVPDFDLPNLDYLNLSENQLSGSIPNINLPKLRVLSLGNNNLSGAIPNFNLPLLEDLELAGNQLTGTIPNFNLPLLIELNLSFNKLTGNIPILNLPKLSYFYAIINQLSGCIPEWLRLLCSKSVVFYGNDNLATQDFFSFCTNNTGGCVDYNCRFQDSLQLIELYKTTNGANWKNKWDLSKPINTWYGISLNGTGCVYQIFLNANNLVGTIPNLQFSNLIALGLNDNQLSGNIPDFNMPSLKLLYLFNNQLTGTIPSFNLLNLTTIALYNNKLSGIVPFFLLSKLEILDLSSNNLTGSIPNFDLPNLNYLNLTDNQLSGIIPNFNLPKLRVLSLGRNNLIGSIPNFNLLALKNLELYFNQLTGTIPNFNLPILETLNLSHNKLNGDIPILNLPSLSFFWIHSNQLSGCIPVWLKLLCDKSVYFDDNPNLATQDFNAFCSFNTGSCSIPPIKKVSSSSKTYQLENSFQIYPNPAKDELNIVLNNNNSFETKVIIYNNLGAIVKSLSLDNANDSMIKTSVSELPTGNYFVRVVSEGKSAEVQRFVIAR